MIEKEELNGEMESYSWIGGFHNLTRRKQADLSEKGGAQLLPSSNSDPKLNKLSRDLSIPQLLAIGVGSTIGAGVYVLVGTVAREQSGPALTLCFLIAGVAAALSAFCYAELASRCPSAGSAYHYSYICIGEGVAWLIGWALILEYTIGGAAVARGISPNLALFFGGQDNLPSFLSRVQVPWLSISVDPCAAILVLAVTALLCLGIKESSLVQVIVTAANVIVMLFVIIAGGYLGFKTGWQGYSVKGGYFPKGINGVLSGSATVFFSYIGFDAIACTAEEVKNPKRDLPWGIGLTLSLCCAIYMMVSVVIVGLVPYPVMDPDTPISSAFIENGMHWAMYVVSTGAILSLCASLLGAILPQPRIMMAMARDGLLPSYFEAVNQTTQVPVRSTVWTGVFAAALAFFMDVSQLAGMVSVGTLLAFTMVAVSILVLRYAPPDEATDPVFLQDQTEIKEYERRRKAISNIVLICLGSLILTSGASARFLPVYLQYIACIVGGLLLLCSSVLLSHIDQYNGQSNFGNSGGFLCPFVPWLPILCITVNIYLLINLGLGTWLRVSVWLLAGILIYIFYGNAHSKAAKEGRAYTQIGSPTRETI
ncbi:cationic amino acid transporter 2 [Rhynchospora pubera]|uniref:Cationic amino acid transporter 2 n=1 Tax=Rhynchospora pubera TaxID=906938 RepID=A0AAV8FZ33_9POAL|nr:cationic amino acid transporter 2 [Rhynchospora pubera]